MAQQIFVDYQTEQRWSAVEAAEAALNAAEDAANARRGDLTAAEAAVSTAQSVYTVELRQWFQHCMNRIQVSPPGGGGAAHS